MRNLSILMLGGAKRVSLAQKLIDAGKVRGIDVSIFSHELEREVPIASVGKVIPGGKYSNDGILNEMRDIIKSFHIDVVLPFVDNSIEVARVCAERYGVFSPTSSVGVASQLFDKVKSAVLFAENNIPIPQTYQSVDTVQFPAIYKPRCGSASKGIKVVNTQHEAEQISNPEEYLIQEYITDREEYTLDCYISMIDGEIKCIVPRLRIATVGGEVIKTRTCRVPVLISLGATVIKSLGLQGCVTLQFLYDRQNKEYKLMEINPRLGGGVVCSVNAGANIADMIVCEATGIAAQKNNVWRDGALMTRYMQEVMFFND
ncbi:MAG: ATP-grasp domain-containing protein [Muribaculaceae bacterium]|nr:ATP-grasp domain-containing protein [Muribaculaceae bacterium]